MAEVTQLEEQAAADAAPVAIQPKTPMDFLGLFPGAPNEAQIDSYKQMVPGGRLRLLPMKDGNRLFLLRGFTALELQQVQTEVAPIPVDKQINAMQVKMSARCTLWTSIIKSGKLTEADLANSGAGLAATLYHTVMDLSDYNDPEVLDQLFVDF